MFFMGCGFISGGQDSGSVFSAAVCKIQASKRYVESLLFVLKDKKAASLRGKKPAVRLLFACALALWK